MSNKALWCYEALNTCWNKITCSGRFGSIQIREI